VEPRSLTAFWSGIRLELTEALMVKVPALEAPMTVESPKTVELPVT